MTSTINKLDQKFYGDIYKAKDGSRVPDDQYVVFLAKDNAFALTLPAYLENCKRLHCDADQIAAVERLINNVATVRLCHPEITKNPDAVGEVMLPNK
jgi:hypothetical protein